MNESIQAVFEHGVFRPLVPVELADQERVSLIVLPTADDKADDRLAQNAASLKPSNASSLERQREALQSMRTAMDALPDQAPHDGLGGADHDQILYGG